MCRVLEYEEEGDDDRDEREDSRHDEADMVEFDFSEQRLFDD